MESQSHTLDYYIEKINTMIVGVNRNVWDASTKYTTPHKQFLILSVMDLINQNLFRSGNVEIIPELIGQFNKYWSVFYNNERSAKIDQPFFHMRTSPFWKLIPVEGKEMELEKTERISSMQHLTRICKGARIDPELIKLIENPESQVCLREAIYDKYFSIDKRTILDSLAIKPPMTTSVSTHDELPIKIKTEKSGNIASIYVELSDMPRIPSKETPSKKECQGFEYISMVQLCNIAEEYGIGRSKACNAFGGDRGRRLVIPERMARVYGGIKFVLVNAAIDYFSEIGIKW